MVSLINFIYIIIIGTIGGIIGTTFGVGSSIVVPGLLLTGISSNYKTALGTNLLVHTLPIYIGAVYNFWKAGYIQLEISILLFIVYFLSATLFSYYTVKYLSNDKIMLGFAIYLLIISIVFFYKYLQL